MRVADCEALLLTTRGDTVQLRAEITLVRLLIHMPATRASRPIEPSPQVEWVVEG
jgi:hypothetical protein